MSDMVKLCVDELQLYSSYSGDFCDAGSATREHQAVRLEVVLVKRSRMLLLLSPWLFAPPPPTVNW